MFSLQAASLLNLLSKPEDERKTNDTSPPRKGLGRIALILGAIVVALFAIALAGPTSFAQLQVEITWFLSGILVSSAVLFDAVRRTDLPDRERIRRVLLASSSTWLSSVILTTFWYFGQGCQSKGSVSLTGAAFGLTETLPYRIAVTTITTTVLTYLARKNGGLDRLPSAFAAWFWGRVAVDVITYIATQRQLEHALHDSLDLLASLAMLFSALSYAGLAYFLFQGRSSTRIRFRPDHLYSYFWHCFSLLRLSLSTWRFAAWSSRKSIPSGHN